MAAEKKSGKSNDSAGTSDTPATDSGSTPNPNPSASGSTASATADPSGAGGSSTGPADPTTSNPAGSTASGTASSGGTSVNRPNLDVSHVRSPWTGNVGNVEQVRRLFTMNDRITDRGMIDQLWRAFQERPTTDPIEVRGIVIDVAFVGARTDEQLTVVRSVIAGQGGGAHLTLFPKLPEAVLYEVLMNHPPTPGQPFTPEDIRDYASQQFNLMGPSIYKDQISDALSGLTGAAITELTIGDIYDTIHAQRLPINAPDFRDRVFQTYDKVKDDEKFYGMFTKAGTLHGVPNEQRRRAIKMLEGLDVDPASDPDWARVALGVLGPAGDGKDILSLAGYGLGSDVGGLETDVPLPDFDDDTTTGLIPENVRILGDLYYIEIFDGLGVFRVVDALAVRFFDELDLGVSKVAELLYVYIKRRPLRFPEADRRHITKRIFGDQSGKHAVFKGLMGRLVETVIEYNRVKNAGDLLVNSGNALAATSISTRAPVIRAVQNLQRYLSDNGGAITQFVTRESGAQLMDCFEILQSPDLQQYYGGRFRSGMWAIIEQVVKELDGHVPPVDRARTLAVSGRKILRWLADHTSNAAVLTDADLTDLSLLIENWLAAYRRPDTQPTWLEDEDYYKEGDPAAKAVAEAKKAAMESNGASDRDAHTADVLA